MLPALSTTLVLLVGQILTEPQEKPDANVKQQRYESFVRAAGLYELRLLTQPLYRHPDESPVALDGALFTFAFGTDPEALLLIEARNTPDGNVWLYAAAPFTDFAIQLKHKDLPVWNEPLEREVPGPFMERPHAGLWQDLLEGAKKQR